MTSRGRGPADDAARHAERQRHRRTGRVPGRKADQTRARESRRTGRPSTARAVGSPDGSSHRGSSPNTTAARPRQQAALPQLRHHAIEPVRPLADVLEKQHVARRAVRTRTACRATPAAASACRRAAARRPRRAERLERRRRELAQRLAAGRARAERRRGRSRLAPRPSRPSSIGPWNATMPQFERQEREQRGEVAVADEQLARATRLRARSSSGSSCALP